MKRLILFAGVVMAGLVMSKIDNGEISMEMVVSVMQEGSTISGESVLIDREIEHVRQAEGHYKVLDDPAGFYVDLFQQADGEFLEAPRGAVLPYDLAKGHEIADFFDGLSKVKNVQTFVVLAENYGMKGRYKIAGSTYGYETPLGNVEPDLNLLDELGISTAYNAFYSDEALATMAPFIKASFPEARVAPILIKENTSEEELRNFVRTLERELGAGNFVIAMSNFASGIGMAEDFHQVLNQNILENFDYPAFDEADYDGDIASEVLLRYLELEGAQKTEFGDYVTFYEGEVTADRELTILAFGDMMLGRYVRTLMDKNGMDYIFEDIRGPEGRFLSGADVVFGNLEGPIKGKGRSGGTSMIFGFNEDIAPFLKRHGFNLMSLANNHAVDQGWDGRDTTIEALEGAGVDWCGHPSEAESDSVYYGRVADTDYAFVCLHDVTFKLDDEAALELIKEVRPRVDHLIVTIHWGYEYQHKPHNSSQVEPGRAFVDAGADFVIGHHPHVVQSFEIYEGKPIFYSLGNFVFDQYWSKATQEELALGIVMGESIKVYLFPMKSEVSQSRLMTKEEREEWIERFIGYGEYDEDMQNQIRSGVIEID